MLDIESLLMLVINAIFIGLGSAIGSYIANRALLIHLEKFEKNLKKRRVRHG